MPFKPPYMEEGLRAIVKKYCTDSKHKISAWRRTSSGTTSGDNCKKEGWKWGRRAGYNGEGGGGGGRMQGIKHTQAIRGPNTLV